MVLDNAIYNSTFVGDLELCARRNTSTIRNIYHSLRCVKSLKSYEQSRKIRYMRQLTWILVALLLVTACTPVRPPAHSFYEVTGSQAERVETITAMIAKAQTPPTPFLDAYFVEEKIGDGEFGPSDYRSFYRLDIASGDITQWQSILSPLATTPNYATPSQPYDWWLPGDDFATLLFYAPDTLTGSLNGWIAIDPANGQIYIYTFTT
jgi:hypothetical protein